MEPIGLVSSLAALFSGAVEPVLYQPRDTLTIVQIYESAADDRIEARYDDAVLTAQDQQQSNILLYTDPMPLIVSQDIEQIDSSLDQYQSSPVISISLSDQGVKKVQDLLKGSDDKAFDMKLAFALWEDQPDADSPNIKIMMSPSVFMGDINNFPQHFQISGGNLSVEQQQLFLSKITMPMAVDNDLGENSMIPHGEE